MSQAYAPVASSRAGRAWGRGAAGGAGAPRRGRLGDPRDRAEGPRSCPPPPHRPRHRRRAAPRESRRQIIPPRDAQPSFRTERWPSVEAIEDSTRDLRGGSSKMSWWRGHRWAFVFLRDTSYRRPLPAGSAAPAQSSFRWERWPLAATIFSCWVGTDESTLGPRGGNQFVGFLYFIFLFMFLTRRRSLDNVFFYVLSRFTLWLCDFLLPFDL